MVIQLVSFKSTLRADSRLRHTAEIINSSKADLILFAGHTLASHWDIDELNKLIDNDKTIAVIEVKENAISVLNPVCNSLFLLQNGVAKDMFTHQLFSDSKNISTYRELGEHLMLELETRRNFSAANRNVSIIQCGENNILRNIQSEGNRAVFRFEDDAILNKRFADFLNNTDQCILPWGTKVKCANAESYLVLIIERIFQLPTMLMKKPSTTSQFSTLVSMVKSKSLWM